MASQIKDYCATCEPCLRRKRRYGNYRAPLIPLTIGMAFERIAVDCLGPLPLTKRGNCYIILFSDYRTKWPEAATVPDIKEQTVARAFYDLIITRHGAPNIILSDRGANFMSRMMREVYAIMNTKKVSTTAYHPQTDGLVERLNATLTIALTNYANSNQDNWCEYVQSILFAYRTSMSSATAETQFMLLYGRKAR